MSSITYFTYLFLYGDVAKPDGDTGSIETDKPDRGVCVCACECETATNVVCQNTLRCHHCGRYISSNGN